MPSRYYDDPCAAFVDGNQLGLRDILPFETELCTPYDPVYASDIPLPARLQDSVPVCLLRLLPDGTCTRKLLISFTNALPSAVEGGRGGQHHSKLSSPSLKRLFAFLFHVRVLRLTPITHYVHLCGGSASP